MPSPNGSLAAAYQGAVRRNAELAGLAALRARYEAELSLTNSLVPRSPTLSGGVRGDQVFRNKGVREFEGAADVPIWLPGESGAQANVARAELARLDARLANQRLVVAGEVRDAYFRFAVAASAINIARRRIDEAQEIEADLVRRVAAGEAQEADLFLARSETVEARTQLQEAEIALREATLTFEALTGVRPPQGFTEATRGERTPGQNPRLTALARTVEVGRASVRLAEVQIIDNPTVGAFLRNERDSRDEPSTTSGGLRFSVPIPIAARTNARVAAARAEVAAAQAEFQAAERQIRSEIEIARVQLTSARAQADLAEQRFQFLTGQVELVRRAFRAGEVGVLEFLRQRNVLLAAELARMRALVAVRQAISRLNQANGFGL